MRHLTRPIAGAYTVSQGYANQWDAEPLGWLFTDGSIGYSNADGSGVAGHWHNGIDYAIPCGTPLLAPGDGVLSWRFDSTGFGLLVIVTMAGNLESYFGHCSRYLVAAGSAVKGGQPVAKSGGGTGNPAYDGNSTGCHLHWSLRDANRARYVDPGPFLRAPTPGPGRRDGITYALFGGIAQAGGTGRYDGPSTGLDKLGQLRDGQAVRFDAWTRGEPLVDALTHAKDDRWYHLTPGPGWVPSARVIGNAPGSTPTAGKGKGT